MTGAARGIIRFLQTQFSGVFLFFFFFYLFFLLRFITLSIYIISGENLSLKNRVVLKPVQEDAAYSIGCIYSMCEQKYFEQTAHMYMLV